MGISFGQPWFLLLLIPAALLLLFLDGRRRYPPRVRFPVRLLRSLILALLVLAAAQPYLVRTSRERSVIFLVDLSRSTAAAPDCTGWINRSLQHKGEYDRAAVLGFARDTQLLKPFAMELLPGLEASLDDGFTGIETALRTASGLIPADGGGRIVLISDGLENSGDSLTLAPLLAARSIPVDTVLLAPPARPEAAVKNIHLPRYSHPGQQFLVEVELESTFPTGGLLTLTWEGTPVYREEITLSSGRQSFFIALEAEGGGFQRVTAHLEATGDTLPQNNRITGLTYVQAPPRVLVVEGSPGKGQALEQVFREGGIEVRLVSAAQLPETLAALAPYRAIYLADVPSYSLTAEQLQNLEHFVQLLGGGLVATGGRHSFGLGFYQDTPLEKLLPVRMEVEQEEELPGLDLVLVIDRSGSMSGEKLNMAKNAAVAALDLLKERDRLAVVTFDDQYYVNLPLTPAADREELAGVITAIGVGGGTIIYPALAGAVELLAEEGKARHIILLSDGMEARRHHYGPLLEKIAGQGITLTAIALGGDADRRLMEQLAAGGGGRYYYVPHSAELPGIFLQETALAGGDFLVEEPFTPAVIHPFVHHFGAAPPRFQGYVASTPKPLSEVLLATHRDHPLLARWQYGLGRSMAFTTDSWGLWSEAFLEHPGFASFWLDTLGWVAPPEGEGDFSLEARLEGGGAVIGALTAEALEEGESFTVTVLDEKGGQQEISLQPEGTGRYTGRLEQLTEGVYFLTAQRCAGGAVTGSATAALAVPYSAEYSIPAQEGEALLEALRRETGGRPLERPGEVFAAPRRPLHRYRDIGGCLLLAALLLWPLDIALRRFNLAPALPALRRKSTGPESAPGPETAPEKTLLEHLLAAKDKYGKKRNH